MPESMLDFTRARPAKTSLLPTAIPTRQPAILIVFDRELNSTTTSVAPSTCKMLGEAAVCLLKDIGKKDLNGGFWTPATAMGQKLMDRLVANAGLTFEVDG